LDKNRAAQSLIYYLWQKRSYRLARWLHDENRFDAAHQITPRFDWSPSYIGAYLPVPFIWGPLGGGENSLSRTQMWGRRSRVWRRCSERAEAILVCNRETKDLFPEVFSRKIMYFPLGGMAESEFPEGKKRVKAGDPFRVITISLAPQGANLELVLKAFQFFSNSHPGCQLQLMCRNGSRESISQLVTGLGLEGNVDFLDWMPRTDLRQTLRAGDMFVYFDKEEEGVSLLIEAMGSGLPVIGRSEGGPGITIHDEWGAKISSGEPYQMVSELARNMEHLYMEKALRRKMGWAARNNVKEHYLWERLGGKLSDLYAEHFLQEESIRHSRQGEGRFFY
jgi:glycosyltransferase involved in cell wall biosynthesis